MTKYGDLSVGDFNIYFITAVGTSDTLLTHHWNSQQAEQPQSNHWNSQQAEQLQSIFLRPVTDAEILQHISTLKNKNLLGWIALR